MTAQQTQAVQPARTPPRLLIRTFWLLHRTIYRFSGGRFGLQLPEAGKRFGMMRLHTVGRRSGRRRIAIVGYYEDGVNLVTMAMNGWGKAPPAWWLNLQSTPEARVDLADGSRIVRGRLATGDERARLWARFEEFPGWGDDLDALAARRPGETAVVVLEPVDRAGSSVRSTGKPWRRSRLSGRHLWLVPGLGLSVFAGLQANELGAGIVPMLLFSIAPDLPRLAQFVMPHRSGQMPPLVVPLFNAMHHPLLPVAMLVGLGLAGQLSPFAYVGGLAWLGHIVIGWAIRDVPKTADGYPRDGVVAPAPVRLATREVAGTTA